MPRRDDPILRTLSDFDESQRGPARRGGRVVTGGSFRHGPLGVRARSWQGRSALLILLVADFAIIVWLGAVAVQDHAQGLFLSAPFWFVGLFLLRSLQLSFEKKHRPRT